MNDPKVQKAVKEAAEKTGKDAISALQDPEATNSVQRQIMETCKEKFPEYAGQAKTKIMEFCNDPEAARLKTTYGAMAGAYVMKAGGALVATIEQGPAGIRFLCFLGSCASVVNSILKLIHISHAPWRNRKLAPSARIPEEAPPEYIAKVPGLNGYQELSPGTMRRSILQDMLLDKCKFLSETLGRGGFYIFQGTLWLCFALLGSGAEDLLEVFPRSLSDILDLAVGLALVACGILNLLMHFGGRLGKFQEKVRQGYEQLGGSSA
eukprot:Skav207421  [mRNA]  locus=scaffold646:242650:245266:- [translate_table: standard]